MAKDDDEEERMKEDAEKALDRKIKATVQWDYICSIRVAKKYIKKESLLQQVICKKCGKKFKTNTDRKLCFSCEK